MNAPLPQELARTRVRVVADMIACQLSPAEMLNGSKGLHSIAYAVDVLSDPRAMPRSAKFQGTAAADNVVAGEAIVIFADANAGLPPYGGPGSRLVHRRSHDDGGVSERR